jgi:diguanylate cyclase (GGDEF)-like protein
MGNSWIVLVLIVVQQSLVALGWALSGWALGLARRAAIQWALASACAAAALGLMLLRPDAPAWLSHGVANLLSLGAMVGLRRGLQGFLRLPARGREHGLLLALMAPLVFGFGGATDPTRAAVAVAGISFAGAWVLSRMVLESWPALRAEFGLRDALLVCVPPAAVVALFAFRAVAGPMQPMTLGRPLESDVGFNLFFVLTLMFGALLFNALLAYLVLRRLVRKLERLSQTDPLTGLVNRRQLMAVIAAQSRWRRRTGQEWSLLLVDLDHFKYVNDRHGHTMGDAMLVAVAGALRGCAREVDTVARMGGEEFCFVLAGTGAPGAAQVAERVRGAVAGLGLRAADGCAVAVTASVGVATSGPDDAPLALLERADRALYRAKEGGRDRVVLASA